MLSVWYYLDNLVLVFCCLPRSSRLGLVLPAVGWCLFVVASLDWLEAFVLITCVCRLFGSGSVVI